MRGGRSVVLQLALAELKGVLSSRMIVGLPGFGYHTHAMSEYNYYDHE